jgi:tetratricopeptide (TPR) repeat protein
MTPLELLQSGHPYKALPLLLKAAHREPTYPNLLNLAAALRATAQFHRTREVLMRCTTMSPDQPEAWNNLAQLATDEGRFGEAAALFQKTCELIERAKVPMSTPSAQNVLLGFAQSLMRLGEFKRAWPLWEYGRLGQHWHVLPGTKRWEGGDAESLLVVCEGGYGDVLNFARWLPIAAQRVKHLSFLIFDGLADWCDWHELGVTEQSLVPSDAPSGTPSFARGVIPLSSELRPRYFSHTTSLLSLPAICGMNSFADVPPVPWEFPPRVEYAGPYRKIGFCWWAEENGQLRVTRRLDQFTANGVCDYLHEFGSVVSLVPERASLYRGDKPWKPKRIDITPELTSWKQTTDLIRNLDFVVTVDTAVAHLAGILQVPTLLLIPLRSDWKWGVRSTHGTWYKPALRYYRELLPSWQAKEICAAVAHAIQDARSRTAERRPEAVEAGEDVGVRCGGSNAL